MKRIFKALAAAAILSMAFVSCGKDDPKGDDPNSGNQGVAPIIVSVEMPTEANALPGTDVTIKGVGFMEGDVIVCKGQDGQGDFTPTVVSVSNSAIVISVPADAVGNYKVEVTRNGKTSTLDGVLYIPKSNKIENIVLPSGPVAWGETLVITADGIEASDKVILESENYADVEIANAASANKVSFTVPNTIYGVNKVKISRDGAISVLGDVQIAGVLFEQALGGVVYYLSDNGLHGLVVYPECVTDAAVNWGPSVPRDPYDAGTEDGIYKGASNTEKLVAQYNKVMEDGTFTYEKESPAVVCSKLSANGYDDWFLPSKAELSELFYVKGTLAEKGLFAVPANNYWTSCEFLEEDPEWDWAMWYVNFYEAENLVTWCADNVAWCIGTIAVRQF